MVTRVLSLVAATAAVLLLGCSAAPRAGPTAQPGITLTPAASPTRAAIASEAAGTASGADDHQLEEVFPDEIAGHAPDNWDSTSGDFMWMLGEPPEANDFLAEAGVGVDQLSGAVALYGSSEDLFILVRATRVRGVHGSDLMARVTDTYRRQLEEPEIGSATIGGKTVTRVAE